MYTGMCDWLILLYSRKLTEHCKPAIMEKNHYIKQIKKKKEIPDEAVFTLGRRKTTRTSPGATKHQL